MFSFEASQKFVCVEETLTSKKTVQPAKIGAMINAFCKKHAFPKKPPWKFLPGLPGADPKADGRLWEYGFKVVFFCDVSLFLQQGPLILLAKHMKVMVLKMFEERWISRARNRKLEIRTLHLTQWFFHPKNSGLFLPYFNSHSLSWLGYSFSHNHGSGNWPYLKGKLLLEGPIFHWTMFMGGRVEFPNVPSFLNSHPKVVDLYRLLKYFPSFLKKMGRNTLPETNIAPENRPSQKELHLPTIHFQVRTVSFREGKLHKLPSPLPT